MSSLSLVHEANALLDELDEKGADAFSLERLEEMRGQMLAGGFSAPFASVMAATRSEADDWSAAESEDVKKQIGNIRYVAALKKFTLNRVRTAIAAQRISNALNLLGYAQYVKYLPLGGSYRKMLFASHPVAVECYHKLMSHFTAHAFEADAATASVELEGLGDGAKIQVDLASVEGAEEKIRELFGPDALVANLKKTKKKVGLIRSYSGKVALFCAASILGSQAAEGKMNEKPEKDGRVLAYNSILAKYKIYPDAALSEVEGFEKAKKELVKAGFMTEDAGDFELEETIAASIAARRRMRKKFAESAAQEFVFGVLLRFYVNLNEAARKTAGLPSTQISPDEKQLAVMAHIAPEKFPLSHIPKVVAEKIEFEGKSIPLAPEVWGPAFVCARGHLDAAWAAKEFAGDEKEIAGAVPMLSSLLEHPEGRGARFLSGAKAAKKAD